ncbi:hypothetical protein SUNI508_01553 [Seiridium unicorne]|uniref:Uncharacterized protein n=1 Tax=Seiridium unicorne TaxID=138068 RepID=A0ABR2UT88_9PEZI
MVLDAEKPGHATMENALLLALMDETCAAPPDGFDVSLHDHRIHLKQNIDSRVADILLHAPGLPIVAENGIDTANRSTATSDDNYVQAEFTVNDTAPASAETEGFVIYGSGIMFLSDDTYLYQFWVQSNSKGLWNLMCNTRTDSEDGSMPIMLKPKAPHSS